MHNYINFSALKNVTNCKFSKSINKLITHDDYS